MWPESVKSQGSGDSVARFSKASSFWFGQSCCGWEVAVLVRQLRGPHLSRCPWWSNRSGPAAPPRSATSTSAAPEPTRRRRPGGSGVQRGPADTQEVSSWLNKLRRAGPCRNHHKPRTGVSTLASRTAQYTPAGSVATKSFRAASFQVSVGGARRHDAAVGPDDAVGGQGYLQLIALEPFVQGTRRRFG